MEMQRQLIGENPGEVEYWVQCPDDFDMMIWLDDVGEIAEQGMGILVIGTCRVWVEAYGAGFLCSTEY